MQYLLLILIIIMLALVLFWLYRLLQLAPISPAGRVPGPYCQGFAHIDWGKEDKPGELTVGELRCNGRCPDGTECTVHHVDYEDRTDNLVRVEWCSCEDDKEPTHCHLRREKYVINGKEIWKTNCRPMDGCPVASDFCREVWREIESPEGIYKRYQVTCECEARQ